MSVSSGAARPHIAHQFDTAAQQHQAAALGMWTFLATEILFFGGLFLGYTVYRNAYHDAFVESSRHLGIVLGTVNTAVLLISSFTMAMAVHAAQLDKRRTIVIMLGLTLILGAVFLGVKGYEYSHKWHEHLVPGAHFAFEGEPAPAHQLFFGFYFVMTGLHAVHMIIGAGVLLVLMIMAWKGAFDGGRSNAVEMMGLYWHFVDCIWIFLFPLLYLIDRT